MFVHGRNFRNMRKIMLSAVCIASLTAGRMMAQDDAVAKGKEVFEQCGVCHNVDNDEKKIGPSLKGLYKKDKLKSGKKVTDASVQAIINAGGGGMPAYADMLSDDEKKNVLAYLKTL